MKLKNPLSFYVSTILVVLIIILQFKSYKPISNENPHPISWDIYGYYLYLPATLIYNDLGLENNEWINKTREKYNPSSTFYQVTNGEGNKKVIIYNVGYAFIFMPGFVIANSLATTLGYEKDGFSKPYQLSLIITALLITIIGIYLLRYLALKYFTDKLSSVIILCIVLGTNYFFQTTYNGVMPHNILFTINCLIIVFTIRWHDNKTYLNICLLGITIGMASLCRPTELLWVLLPLFWTVFNKVTLQKKLKDLLKNYLQIILFTIILIGIVGMQFLYYKYASGTFFNLNLHSETFSFFDPYTFQFLFSFKKGWLVYTPMMFFSIIGFYYMKKQNKTIWLPLLLFFIINLYVVSSWECWWYAASFGQRPMVETYAMMFLPLGYFIRSVNDYKKPLITTTLYVAFLILISLNLFQTWQFNSGIIDSERMTKAYYLKVFSSTKENGEDKKLLSVDRYQTTFFDYDNYLNSYYKKDAFFMDYENEVNENIIDTLSVSGKKCFKLDEKTPFSSSFEENYFDITFKSYMWVRASVWVYLTAPYTESNSCIVVSTETKGKSYKYQTSNYENFNVEPYKWTEVYIDYLTPDIRHDYDKIKIYFWNMGKSPVLIDDFKITCFEPKRDYK